MPELPEVETTRRGIEPQLIQQTISKVIIRNSQLRWPLAPTLTSELPGQIVAAVTRRGKYLLLNCMQGTLIIHLGMSGSLRILPSKTTPGKHDHIDIIFNNEQCLRYTDPRRFGSLLWTSEDPQQHPLLKDLGPEPLTADFTDDHLYLQSRNRNIPVKSLIMDGKIVVGVGNIYANEALFMAKINPQQPAKSISKVRYQLLSAAIRQVLTSALKQGGTTLRDFVASDGKPGYFIQQLQVYGRAGLKCSTCKTLLAEIVIAQRATVYCTHCQPITY